MTWHDEWEEISDTECLKGGQGTVRKVRHKSTHGIGALKLPHPDLPKKRLKRFRREVMALERLEGVGTPKVLASNVDTSKGCPLYLIEEWIEGPTLHKHVQDGKPLSLRDALKLLKSLAITLEGCHEAGLVHRDIKPDNLIVKDPSTLILVDFGLAFHLHREGDSLETKDQEELGNRFLRLPDFTAGRKKRDPRSDVTLAVGVFFFMLTGTYPRVLRDERGRPPHIGLERVFPSDVRSDARWDRVVELFDRGFQSDVESRFQNAAELRASVHRVFDNVEFSPLLRGFLLCKDVVNRDNGLTISGVLDEIHVEEFPFRLSTKIWVALGKLTKPEYRLEIRAYTPGFENPATRTLVLKTGGEPLADLNRAFDVVIPITRPGLLRFELNLGEHEFGPFLYPVGITNLTEEQLNELRGHAEAKLQAFLACDRVENHEDGTCTIDGVANSFYANRFPVDIPLTYYLAANNLDPERKHEVEICYPNGSRHVSSPLTITSPMGFFTHLVFSNGMGFRFNRDGVMNVAVKLNSRMAGAFVYRMEQRARV